MQKVIFKFYLFSTWGTMLFLFVQLGFLLCIASLPAGKGRSAAKQAHKALSGLYIATCLCRQAAPQLLFFN
jgi:hypothetical protein